MVYPDKTKKTGSTLKLTPTLSTPRAATSTATTQTYFWGETQQGNCQLPDAQTVFGIGSVGKVFTATLLADMVFNQKLLALNDLVQPYYDKLAPGVVTLPTFKGQVSALFIWRRIPPDCLTSRKKSGVMRAAPQ